MIRHGGDEAKLSFEAVHFKCLLQDKEESQKLLNIQASDGA